MIQVIESIVSLVDVGLSFGGLVHDFNVLDGFLLSIPLHQQSACIEKYRENLPAKTEILKIRWADQGNKEKNKGQGAQNSKT
jgi:hypothetical protein